MLEELACCYILKKIVKRSRKFEKFSIGSVNFCTGSVMHTVHGGKQAAACRHGEGGRRWSRRTAAPGKLYRARSRLYRNEILQENMRLSRFDSIFQVLQDLHTSAPLQSQKENEFGKLANGF